MDSEQRTDANQPSVLILAGSTSDVEKFFPEENGEKPAALKILQDLGIPFELASYSTHRNPSELRAKLDMAMKKYGVVAVVSLAGMSAALPGDVRAILNDLGHYRVCVYGVPLPRPEKPDAEDALNSMLHCPPGTPVSVQGIGKAGLINTMLAVAHQFAVASIDVDARLREYYDKLAVEKKPRDGIYAYPAGHGNPRFD